MKKLTVICLSIMMLFSSLTVHADDNNMLTVKELPFKLSINDKDINKNQRKYPFLFYKNIVYFPLTFSDAAAMGLKTEWDEDSKTLSINSNFMKSENLDIHNNTTLNPSSFNTNPK